MTFFALTIATLLTGFGLGFAKFFWLGILSTSVYTAADKPWIIQILGSIITLGPVLVYPFSGPLAGSMQKRQVMFLSCLATAFVFCLALLLGFGPQIWLYVLLIGGVMGLFSAAKMASVPLEANRQKYSIFTINGVLTIVFLIGMFAGTPLGNMIAESSPQSGILCSIFLFVLAGLISLKCAFPQEDILPYAALRQSLVRDSMVLTRKLSPYLISSPLIWGISSACSLAIVAHCEAFYLADSTQSTLVLPLAGIGIVLGNLIAPRFVDYRYSLAFATSLFLMFLIAGFPWLISLAGPGTEILANRGIFYLALGLSLLIGISFGIVTNLVDAEYLHHSGEMKLESTGAAFQSALIALFSASMGGLSAFLFKFGLTDSHTQFLVFSLVFLIALFQIGWLLLRHGDARWILGLICLPPIRLALFLRYRLEVRGLENLPRCGGLLFLPNHPAEVDPLILMSLLWKSYRPQPFATETFYDLPVLNSLMRLIRAQRVPNTEDGNSKFKAMRIRSSLKECVKKMQAGENFLFYPAGRLMRSGLERMRGASGLHAMLSEDPGLRLVLISTRGLWGSQFSTALTGGVTPHLLPVLGKALIQLMKNLIFFAPRRKVQISFEIAPLDFPKNADKLTLNRYLDEYYNKEGEEPLNLVPLTFYSSATAKPLTKTRGAEQDIEIQPDVYKTVIQEVCRLSKKEESEISLPMSLSEDLGLDSLDRAEFISFLDQKFHVTDVEMAEITTVASLMRLATHPPVQHHENEGVKPLKKWVETSRPPVQNPTGATILESFLLVCDRMPKSIAMADETTPPMTYKRLKTAVLALSEILREEKGQRIGILLPASCGTAIVVMATLAAGKTPVMLNWTLGAKNLEHVVKVSGIENILTSIKFLDRAGDIDLGEIEKNLVYLENLRREKLDFFTLLFAFTRSLHKSRRLLEILRLENLRPEDAAVILFTSGSENVPKGVPLSHRNILGNISSAATSLGFEAQDVVYGFLPPFHSFGFTVTTIMPMICGMKVAYYPNPTDSRRLARGLGLFGGSIICGTPSFLRGILRVADKAQTRRLRYLIAGAEKADEELFERTYALGVGARVLEGYGITECSPILSFNRHYEERCGVGRPLQNVEILIVDMDTLKPLPAGQRGLILARGESVFAGYLGGSPNPFLEVGGKQYYNTGDLGYLTEQGHLILAGRLKRFVKVGGEMISLPVLEEVLSKIWPADENGPCVAVESMDVDGSRPIVALFSTMEISLDEANQKLKEAQISNVARLSHCLRIEAIPLLGTGKTDYRRLKAMLADLKNPA